MIFNDVDLSDKIIVRKINRSVAPPILNVRMGIPGRAGTVHVRTEHNDRIVSVDVALVGPSRADYLEQVADLAKMICFSEEKELILPDEPDYTYMAILDGETEMKELVYDGEGTLTFLCRPYKLGMTKFSTGSSVNAGAVECPVKITATFTADEASDLTISDGTDSIVIDGPFSNGDVLVIEDGYVTLNDANNMANVQVSSVFFKLPVGDFSITADSSNVELVLEWTELWL